MSLERVIAMQERLETEYWQNLFDEIISVFASGHANRILSNTSDRLRMELVEIACNEHPTVPLTIAFRHIQEGAKWLDIVRRFCKSLSSEQHQVVEESLASMPFEIEKLLLSLRNQAGV